MTVWLRGDVGKSIFAAAIFLVSVPVFIEAPIARYLPVLGLALTLGWLGLSWLLWQRPATRIWGDLLLGFAGSWFAGCLYWGWFRAEPLLHLPVEAIALPLPLWLIYRRRALVGSWFAIGSFAGTAVTDLYFFLVGLIPYWRTLMRSPLELSDSILHAALFRVHSPLGIGCAAIFALLLMVLGGLPSSWSAPHWKAFGGAVLSTILVDVLFWLSAAAA